MTQIKTLLSMLYVLLAFAAATLFFALCDSCRPKLKQAPIKSDRHPHFKA